jgi:hypothetical protein
VALGARSEPPAALGGERAPPEALGGESAPPSLQAMQQRIVSFVSPSIMPRVAAGRTDVPYRTAGPSRES